MRKVIPLSQTICILSDDLQGLKNLLVSKEGNMEATLRGSGTKYGVTEAALDCEDIAESFTPCFHYLKVH